MSQRSDLCPPTAEEALNHMSTQGHVEHMNSGRRNIGGKQWFKILINTSLHVLPVPNSPWSHIVLDFITNLPDFDGNTVILVIIGRFSSSLRPLATLTMAFELAELMFNQVFHFIGLRMW